MKREIAQSDESVGGLGHGDAAELNWSNLGSIYGDAPPSSRSLSSSAIQPLELVLDKQADCPEQVDQYKPDTAKTLLEPNELLPINPNGIDSLKRCNPILEELLKSDPPITPAVTNRLFETALHEQDRVRSIVEAMKPEDRRKWRDLQIELSQAPSATAAAQIRRQRNKAFPAIASSLQRAKDFSDAGRHLEADALLTHLFPGEGPTHEFKHFILNSDLQLKEGLASSITNEIFAQNRQRFQLSPQRNSNFYDRTSATKRLGEKLINTTPLYWEVLSRLATENNKRQLHLGENAPGAVRSGINQSEPKTLSLFNYEKQTNTADKYSLGTANSGVEICRSRDQSSTDYAKRLSQIASSSLLQRQADDNNKLSFRLEERTSFFDLINSRTPNFELTDLLDHSIKTAADRSIQELENPGQPEQISLRAERLRDELQHQFETREDLRGCLTEPDGLTRAFQELTASSKHSPQKKLDFIENLERLIDPNCQAVAPLSDRLILAGQLVHQALNIGTIDQGMFGSCAMGTLEKILYSRDLALLGRMVKDVALHGQTKCDSGQTLLVESQSLLGGQICKRTVPPTDNVRSLASQYVTLICAQARFQIYNEQNKTKYGFAHEDGRDVVKDYSTNPPGYVYHLDYNFRSFPQDQIPPTGYRPLEHPYATLPAMLDVYERLTNKPSNGLVIASGFVSRINDARVSMFYGPHALERLLRQRSEEEFPIILAQPGHVATIDSYNPMKEVAEYDNQWGDENDRLGKDAITTLDLWRIAHGDYPFALSQSSTIRDDLDSAPNPKYSGVSSKQLTEDLIKTRKEPSSIAEACDLAQELKVRNDLGLSATDRIVARQAVNTVQENLRAGKITAVGIWREHVLTPDERMLSHDIVFRRLCSMHDQVFVRTVLSEVLQKAGRTMEAESALLQAKKLADQLPFDLIAAERSLLDCDAEEATNEDQKNHMQKSKELLGGPPDEFNLNTTANLPNLVRLKLLELYSGYDPHGSFTFKVYDPVKAAEIAEELRLSGIKTMGVDWIKDAELEPPRTAGETNLSKRREFLTHLQLLLAARKLPSKLP